ncbi:Membrane protein involved in the export of O-antigen and teichoic acid [Faunimonas pinastri]|uniref:Membrane protein involved in the export of O-antigen and teichoic acid n=1 Tax=Faunimonas pinastri TaxID=1855383 RepID=A0A1H8ZW86_9HYPH|nr:flippase [Faunimonas pinastri]SEP68543.1 Membrane protein involved in the export of O-antigen and teichoic acid [Faunimonas pinastri]
MSASPGHPAGHRPSRLRRGFAQARAFLSQTDERAVARRSSALAFGIRLSNAALAYIAQLVLARLMGSYEYGIFAYIWAWFLVFASLSTLGFSDSPVRYIPQMREHGEMNHLRGFLRAGPLIVLAASIGSAALIEIGLLVGHPWIDGVYFAPMTIMALALPFGCLQGFFEGVGRSYFWTVPALFPTYILRHLLLMLGMIAVVWTGFAPTSVNALFCLLGTLVISSVYQTFAITGRVRRTVPVGPREFRVRSWIGGSIPFSVMYGASQLFTFSDVIVLSFFVSPAEIAVYFAATRIMQVTQLIPYAATIGTAHVFSALHARGDREGLQRIVREVSFFTFALAFVVTGILALGGHWLLAMFGREFTPGYPALAILALGMIARVAAGPAEDLLNMTGHGRFSAWTAVGAVVLNLALNFALVIPFGIEGSALATSLAIAIRAVWLTFAVRRLVGVETSIFSSRPSLSALRRRFAKPSGDGFAEERPAD